jgi:hypothetical protein
MNFLYKGAYFRRFKPVCRLISGKTVTELCFGDIVVARYCKDHQIQWTGLDINPAFVHNAELHHFKASVADIRKTEIPAADTLVICGSLYHFHSTIDDLFLKMLNASGRIVLSEPVRNLSSGKGIIGKLAKASAKVEGEDQPFRYTEETLRVELERMRPILDFRYRIVERISKDIVILIEK